MLRAGAILAYALKRGTRCLFAVEPSSVSGVPSIEAFRCIIAGPHGRAWRLADGAMHIRINGTNGGRDMRQQASFAPRQTRAR
jgi:hypothetical protein